MAKSTGNARIQSEVLATQGLLYYGDKDSIDAAQAALEEAIELGRANDLPYQESRARNNITHILGSIRGDPQAAREQLARATHLAHQAGDIGMELFTGAHGSSFGILLGDLSDVEEELDKFDELIEGLVNPGTAGFFVTSVRDTLGWARGYAQEFVETAQPLQAELRETGDLQSLWEINNALARAYIELGQFEEAEAASQEIIELGGLDSATRGSPHVLKSIALSKRGDVSAARELLEEVRDNTSIDFAAWYAVDVLDAEAHLAIAERRWSDAWTAFEKIVSRLGEMGMRVPHARALREWADGHIAHGEPEDMKRAVELLDEARFEFDEIGSIAYVASIDAQIAELDS